MDNSDEPKSFFKHVFNFDDDSKSEIINIIQYTLIAIIPVIVLNKSMQKYVPEADDKKSSIEISAEIIIQVVVMFIGVLLIHRIITFVPTYSGAKYPEFHVIFIVLGVLMITLSLQTKLGEKVSILSDRVYELWNGKQEVKKKQSGGKVKVSQPISGQSAGSDGTSINLLPRYDTQPTTNTPTTEPLPNYDTMHRQDTNPLIGAATPGIESMSPSMEPFAANSVLGGSAWSSW